MAVDLSKIVEKINDGGYSMGELQNLKKNAIDRGIEKIVIACDAAMLANSKTTNVRTKKTHEEIAELRCGFNVMASAFGDDNRLLKPELISVAEELSKNANVTEISVLKTQISLYYKGRHFTSGIRTKKSVFWISCLDETKIADKTIEHWMVLGDVVKGKYFSTNYILVEVRELKCLHQVLECVSFT